MKTKTNIPLILFTMLATFATSCNKEYHDPRKESAFPPIYFGIQDFAETKADLHTNTATDIQTNGFKVAAVTDSKVKFFNAVATYNATKGIYATSSQYYFPTSGKLNFYAAYPQSTTITENTTTGGATIAYTHNPATDLICASALAVAKQTAGVSLAFDHVLSQLAVTCKGTDTSVTYKVLSVTVKGFSAGTYTFDASDKTKSEMKGTIAMTAAETYYSNTSGGLAVSTSSTTSVGEKKSYIPGTVKIEVHWKTYNGELETGDYTRSADITLQAKNTNTVNFSLPNDSASSISFSLSVNDWGNVAHNVALNS